jgi:uroporphyrinogen-III synthase
LAVLVTRPQPDNDMTARALRKRGFAVLLAPMLRFEPVAFRDDPDAGCDAVLVTSANALRALEGQATAGRLAALPLFAVGEHTAEAARRAGFAKVLTARGSAADLRDLVLARIKARKLKKDSVLLHLAGADLSGDLAGELSSSGLHVVTQTVYRMAPTPGLPHEVCAAFAAHGIEAVLHYSRRSARAFLEAARADGVEISALAVPQCCLSDGIAGVLREAGAAQVAVAAKPDENALFEALERALRARLA